MATEPQRGPYRRCARKVAEDLTNPEELSNSDIAAVMTSKKCLQTQE